MSRVNVKRKAPNFVMSEKEKKETVKNNSDASSSLFIKRDHCLKFEAQF